MEELVFEVSQEDDGGFVAICELPDGLISTQGDNWKELEAMVRDAVGGYFEGRLDAPTRLRLHLEREEILPVAG